MQAAVEAELAAPEVPPNDVQASMDEPLAAQAGSAGQALGNPPGGKPDAGKSSQATIRVDLDRVDRLINLVGELVITRPC